MGRIALITCREAESADDVGSSGWIKRLFKGFYELLAARGLQEAGLSIASDAVPEICVIEIPFPVNFLSACGERTLGKLKKWISDECARLEVRFCLYSGELLQKTRLAPAETDSGRFGEYLFKALLPGVMEEIFLQRGIRPGELDIAVIAGHSRTELLTVLSCVLPMVKYITVVTHDKEQIREEAGRIFEETGLSMMVTSDYEASLKYSDLIINLGNLHGEGTRIKPNRRSIILNYGHKNVPDRLAENTVINGVAITLPGQLQAFPGDRIINRFDKGQLAWVMLTMKLFGDVCRELPDCARLRQIYRAFRSEGYGIAEYAGRHGTVGKEQIRIVMPVEDSSGTSRRRRTGQ